LVIVKHRSNQLIAGKFTRMQTTTQNFCLAHSGATSLHSS